MKKRLWFVLILVGISGSLAVAFHGDPGEKRLYEIGNENLVTLKCLPEKTIEHIRKSGSVDEVVSKCRQELLTVFGKDFGLIDDQILRAFLSTVVASNFAEYGDSSAIEYKDLASSEYLNCGNTIFLVGYLYGDLESKKIRPIGFHGGAIGNHAQLLFYSGDRQFLLDPTAGIIAAINFNDLMRGIPLSANKIRMFSIKAKSIESFRQNIYLAITQGKYLPSDFMYMHESLSEQKKKGSALNYFTPGGIEVRKRPR